MNHMMEFIEIFRAIEISNRVTLRDFRTLKLSKFDSFRNVDTILGP